MLLCQPICVSAQSYSGDCGNDTTWNLNTETGQLVISGNGKVTSSPWKNYKNQIKNVIIENGVLELPNSAFAYCTNLENVVLGDGVTSTGNYAFSGCSKLSDIQIGNSVKRISACSFDSCSSLTQVVIPNSVITIDGGAFGYCNTLERVELGNGITSIGNYAFSGCSSIKEISIPQGVSLIGNYAFSGCRGIKEINLNEDLAVIGNNAFEYCSNIENVFIPRGITQLGEQVFNACSNLKRISVSSENLNYFADDIGVLFSKDKSKIIQYPMALEQELYIVPEGVNTINDWAFYNSQLKYVYLPQTITTIGYAAFYECNNMLKVYFEANIDDFKNVTILAQNSTLDKAEKVYDFTFCYGDINTDGKINVMDVTVLRLYLLGKYDMFPLKEILDVNFDGKVDIKDVTILKQYIVGGYGIILNNYTGEGGC